MIILCFNPLHSAATSFVPILATRGSIKVMRLSLLHLSVRCFGEEKHTVYRTVLSFRAFKILKKKCILFVIQRFVYTETRVY